MADLASRSQGFRAKTFLESYASSSVGFQQWNRSGSAPIRPPSPPDRVGGAAQHREALDARYVGEHTPLVKLSPIDARGIRQSGLAVRKGRSYTGRAVLAGTPGTTVKVTLIWGNAANDRQSVTIAKLRTEYGKFPLSFQVQGDSDDARLEITGTGTGSLRIGAVSLMPASNVQGFRVEVIGALKQLHSGVYRFPGGNLVSGHEWRDAIGDPDQRPPIMDPVWHAVQPNDVGTDELVELCLLLGQHCRGSAQAGCRSSLRQKGSQVFSSRCFTMEVEGIGSSRQIF